MPSRTAVRQYVALDAALEQIVGRLHGVNRRNPAEPVHLLGRKVTDADSPNLSLLVERGHRGRRFLDRRGGIRPMDLVDVDHVGLKPFERRLDFLEDATRAGVAQRLTSAPVQADLGREDRAIPQATFCQRLADNFFRSAEAIDRRRIDQVDAVVERRANRVYRLALIGSAPHPSANRPGSKTDSRYLDLRLANFAELHGLFSCHDLLGLP